MCMLTELKAIVENMKSEIVRVEEIIATLELQNVVAEELVVETVVSIEDHKSDIRNAFNVYRTELVRFIEEDIYFEDEIVMESIDDLAIDLCEKYSFEKELVGYVNSMWIETANLLGVVQIKDRNDISELTNASIQKEVAGYYLSNCAEDSNEFHNYLDQFSYYDDLYEELLSEMNAFSTWVDESVKSGILY